MPLVNTKKMLLDALDNNYAVGAFNFTTLEQAKAIVNAVKTLNSPAILSVSESAANYIGINIIVDFIKKMSENVEQNIALHLDHGKSFEICKKAMDSGFTSIMIDASDLPLDENISITKKVIDYAHPKNITVEAELGQLKGIEDNINVENTSFTNEFEAKKFVDETKVDSLAISIGTSHGAYKFQGKPSLNIDLLKKIRKAIPDTPLVLHGASSVSENLKNEFIIFGGQINKAIGIPENLLIESIKNGISKINVDTDLRIAFTTGVRKYLSLNKKDFNLRNYLSEGQLFMEKELVSKIKLFGSSKK